MKVALAICLFIFLLINSCTTNASKDQETASLAKDSVSIEDSIINTPRISIESIVIEKQLTYDNHTLEDTYPYKDTVREFQWEKIRQRLFLLDSIQIEHSSWAILSNYRNQNGEAPLVRNFNRNEYKRVSDTLDVERYQSVPLFLENDSLVAEVYGRDGSLVKLMEEVNDSIKFVKVQTVFWKGEWIVPRKYVKAIADTAVFKKAIFVDLTNQNIATLEKVDSIWFIRSMNPATTGVHRPPYAQETPPGIFVIQERKAKMIFLKDGTTETGGFAPWASRFTNGAYIHGVPVNVPRTTTIEFSPSLGTTPRSHMCVRNATSHAKFVYDWTDLKQTIVFVFQ